MNGSKGYRAQGASEKPRRQEVPLSLTTARRMLPLVRQVVADILAQQKVISQLEPEQTHLDRNKRTLAWPERARRYQIREDVAAAEKNLEKANAELDALGLTLE